MPPKNVTLIAKDKRNWIRELHLSHSRNRNVTNQSASKFIPIISTPAILMLVASFRQTTKEVGKEKSAQLVKILHHSRVILLSFRTLTPYHTDLAKTEALLFFHPCWFLSSSERFGWIAILGIWGHLFNCHPESITCCTLWQEGTPYLGGW